MPSDLEVALRVPARDNPPADLVPDAVLQRDGAATIVMTVVGALGTGAMSIFAGAAGTRGWLRTRR